MTAEVFDKLVHDLQARELEILRVKGAAYSGADPDRLDAFRVIADLRNYAALALALHEDGGVG
jgi:hypothetical protein